MRGNKHKIIIRIIAYPKKTVRIIQCGKPAEYPYGITIIYRLQCMYNITGIPSLAECRYTKFTIHMHSVPKVGFDVSYQRRHVKWRGKTSYVQAVFVNIYYLHAAQESAIPAGLCYSKYIVFAFIWFRMYY